MTDHVEMLSKLLNDRIIQCDKPHPIDVDAALEITRALYIGLMQMRDSGSLGEETLMLEKHAEKQVVAQTLVVEEEKLVDIQPVQEIVPEVVAIVNQPDEEEEEEEEETITEEEEPEMPEHEVGIPEIPEMPEKPEDKHEESHKEEVKPEPKVFNLPEHDDSFPFVKADEQQKQKYVSTPDLFSAASVTIADKFKEKESLHDKIAHNKEDKSVVSRLQQQPITDLKKSIGINDKFLFINELFNGSMNEYAAAVDHINDQCATRAEAHTYVDEIAEKYQWDGKRISEKLFRNFIDRRHQK
ncbi:MAG: hypothetical protein KKA07_09165 [Bacteroidetes bacterium]|nr:hypothetical protein [Bacteroidota bacterium]MBU1719230.1 hypothetical protein [Bacteroidota bacterium]